MPLASWIRLATQKLIRLITKSRLRAQKIVRELCRRFRLFWPRFISVPSQLRRGPPADEKEFQRRVLLALERSPNRSISAFLNSALFIWLLTAICIAVGGSVFTQRQKCIAEAETLSWKYIDLTDEIARRDDYMRRLVRNAKTFSDVAKGHAAYSSLESEYRGKSLTELNRLRFNVISFAYDMYHIMDFLQQELPDHLMENDILQMIDNSEPQSLSSLKENEKEYAKILNQRASKQSYFDSNCSMGSVINQLISGRNNFLVYVRSPA